MTPELELAIQRAVNRVKAEYGYEAAAPVEPPTQDAVEALDDADAEFLSRLDAQLTSSNIAALKENPAHLRGPLGGLTIVAREARARLVTLTKEANDLHSWGRKLKAERNEAVEALRELADAIENSPLVAHFDGDHALYSAYIAARAVLQSLTKEG